MVLSRFLKRQVVPTAARDRIVPAPARDAALIAADDHIA